MRAFELNPEQRNLMLDIAEHLGLTTNQELVQLLHVMAKEGKVTRVWDTERSREQFIKDMAKNYKVLHVKAEKGDKIQ